MNPDEVSPVLQFRVDVYNALRHLYFFGPRPRIIDELVHIFDRIDTNNTNPDLSASLNSLDSLKSLELGPDEGTMEGLQYEFSRLFIGPGRPTVPLFESMYRSPDSLLMQETAISMRNHYLSSGLVSSGPNHIPEDHLAVELEYLYYLAGETLKSFQCDNSQSMISHLKMQLNFLFERLDWIAKIVDLVAADSDIPAITGLVKFTYGIMQEDIDWMESYIETVPAVV